jgi:predicted negative regulator of RcsB-dependent stress response
MAKKLKVVDRKEALKQPDDFISLSSQVIEYISKNLKVVLLGLGLIILVGGGWGVWKMNQTQRQEKAAELLQKASLGLSRPETTSSTLEALRNIVAEYPHTGAALQALILQAHLLYQDKKFTEAGAVYESLRGQDPGLEPLVTENLSYCYEAQKEYKKAAEVLDPLIGDAKLPYQGEMLRRQALLYEQGGDIARSLAAYRRLLEQNPKSTLSGYLKEKITSLEGKKS